jgi:tetratricopeptide (TPR) repeat protein
MARTTGKIPSEGVSLRYLILFSKENRERLEGLTTMHVCQEIIKPLTITNSISSSRSVQAQESWAYTMHVKQNYGSQHVRHASHIVSHPWRCKFLKLVAALEQWARAENDFEVFLWIDIFSLDQHQPKPSFETLGDRFADVVKVVGKGIVVLSPWDGWKQPVWLDRAWCLYEFFLFSLPDGDASSKLQFVILEEEKVELVRAFMRGWSYEEVLSRINLEDAVASIDHEGVKIKETVQNRVGYSVFNQSVRAVLKKHLLPLIKEASDKLGDGPLEPTGSKVQHLYSKLLVEERDFEGAKKLLARRLRDLMGGVDSNNSLPRRQPGGLLAQLSGLLPQGPAPSPDDSDLRERERARRRLWRRRLALREESRFQTQSESDEEAADPLVLAETMEDYATVHDRMGHLAEAERWLDSALQLREEKLGGVHVAVAITRHRLAEARRRLGRSNPEEVLDMLRKVRPPHPTPPHPHDSHPRPHSVPRSAGGASRCRDGPARTRIGQALEVLEHEEKARRAAEAQADPSAAPAPRPDLLAADVKVSMGNVYLQQRRYKEAIAQYDVALKEQGKARGGGHLSVAETRSNLGAAYLGNGARDRALQCHAQAVQAMRRAGLAVTDPLRFAAALRGLGMACEALEDSDEALAHYDEAARIGDAHARADARLDAAAAHADLAILRKKRGELPAACASYERALALRRAALDACRQELRAGGGEAAGGGLGWLVEGGGAAARGCQAACAALLGALSGSGGAPEPLSAEDEAVGRADARGWALLAGVGDTLHDLGACRLRAAMDAQDKDARAAERDLREALRFRAAVAEMDPDTLRRRSERQAGRGGEEGREEGAPKPVDRDVLVADTHARLGLLYQRRDGGGEASKAHLAQAKALYIACLGPLDDCVAYVEDLLH